MSNTISNSTDALSDQLLAESFPDLEPSNVYIYSETEVINDELSDILRDYLEENQSSHDKEPTEINYGALIHRIITAVSGRIGRR